MSSKQEVENKSGLIVCLHSILCVYRCLLLTKRQLQTSPLNSLFQERSLPFPGTARTISGFIRLSRCSGMPCCVKGEKSCVFCCTCQPSIYFCYPHLLLEHRGAGDYLQQSLCERLVPLLSISGTDRDKQDKNHSHCPSHPGPTGVKRVDFLLNSKCLQPANSPLSWFRRLLKVRGIRSSNKNLIQTAFLRGTRSIINMI